jgi:hypothetical protein
VNEKANAKVFRDIKLIINELDLSLKILTAQKKTVWDYCKLQLGIEYDGFMPELEGNISNEMLSRIFADLLPSLNKTLDDFRTLQERCLYVQEVVSFWILLVSFFHLSPGENKLIRIC